MQWKEYLNDKENFIMYLPSTITKNDKVAGFDLDDTLVCSKSGKKFTDDPNDWRFLYESDQYQLTTVDKLKEIQDEHGYKIVIFSNQRGVTSKGFSQQKLEIFKKKVENITSEEEKYNIHIELYAALSDNVFRKPLTGMYEQFIKNNDKVAVDKCIFVGDAAGRVKDWKKGKGKDFSCSDREFAKNIHFQFFTPEEFFLFEKPCRKYHLDDIRINKYKECDDIVEELGLEFDTHEMIIFVGSPASGKTSFYNTYLKNKKYVHVSRDVCGSMEKCISEVKKSIKTKSVVIDNTNPKAENRERFITLAQTEHVPVRCFYFNYDKKLTYHLNEFRKTVGGNSVPQIAYNTYYKSFEKPKEEEGFDEIVEIPFRINNKMFKNDKERKLFGLLF